MALMRGTPYVYRNYEDMYVIHTNPLEPAVRLDRESTEELAVMVVSNLDPDQLAAAITRVVEKHGGNFGASAVLEGLGLPTAYDMVKQALAHGRDA